MSRATAGSTATAGPSSSSSRNRHPNATSAVSTRAAAIRDDEEDDDIQVLGDPADLLTVITKLDRLLSSAPFHDLGTLINPTHPGRYTPALLDALDLFAHVQLVDEYVSLQIRLALAKQLKLLKAGKVEKALPSDVYQRLKELLRSKEEEGKRRQVYYAFSSMLRVMVSSQASFLSKTQELSFNRALCCAF